jgi:peptide/nickel transport system permease protein
VEVKTKLSTQPAMGAAAMPKEETYLSMVWRRFRRHKLAVVSLVILVVLYAMAIFAPYVAPYHHSEMHFDKILQPPSRAHLLGTDRIGGDILSRIIWGSRISLSVGFIAAGIALTVGTVVGSLAGYFAGTVIDDILMRFTETIAAFPVMFLLLTVIALLPRSTFNIMVVIGLTSWPNLARMVRGQFLSLREMDYVEAARAVGATDTRIVFVHILLNSMAPIIVSATLRIGGAILAESGLAFLGLGMVSPPSWGTILNGGRPLLRQAPWIMMFPGLFIFVTVLAFNYVGDGLRDALDPRATR